MLCKIIRINIQVWRTDTVHRIIFSPCYFRPSTLGNGFDLSWIHTDAFVLKGIIFARMWFAHFGICPLITRTKGAKIKQAKYFSVYSYTITVVDLLLIGQFQNPCQVTTRNLGGLEGMVHNHFVDCIIPSEKWTQWHSSSTRKTPNLQSVPLLNTQTVVCLWALNHAWKIIKLNVELSRDQGKSLGLFFDFLFCSFISYNVICMI